MDTHEHLSAHERPWTHMNSCLSKYNAAGKLLVEPYVSQFLNSYLGLLAIRVFNLLVFSWTEHYLYFYVLCFLFCPVVVSRPEKNLCWFLQNMIFDFCINSYLFIGLFTYLFIQIYIYIYIYICIYLCIYIYRYIFMYIYINMCVN